MGSGAVESAVRRLVNLRIKGNGITWRKENAEGMLALRAAAITDRWDETLEHVRATMASDRRTGGRGSSPNASGASKPRPAPLGPVPPTIAAQSALAMAG